MIKENEKITQREINYMVETGKRYFNAWNSYSTSPYAEYKRLMDELYGEQRTDQSDREL